jgi:ribosomal protein L40E
MSVRIEDDVEITTMFIRGFGYNPRPRDGGFSFPSDEHGNVNVASLNPLAAENYRKCVAGEFDVVDIGVQALENRVQLCHCGSGLYPEDIVDGKGIFLCRVCDKCKAQRLKGYRSDIFEDYETEEQIDEDY